MSLVQSQSVASPYVNGGNVHGGAFVTDKPVEQPMQAILLMVVQEARQL